MTLNDLRQVGFADRVTKPKLAELLGEKYPDYKFDKVYLLKGRFAQQKRLERAVAALFVVRLFFSFCSTSFLVTRYNNNNKKGGTSVYECKERSRIGGS